MKTPSLNPYPIGSLSLRSFRAPRLRFSKVKGKTSQPQSQPLPSCAAQDKFWEHGNPITISGNEHISGTVNRYRPRIINGVTRASYLAVQSGVAKMRPGRRQREANNTESFFI